MLACGDTEEPGNVLVVSSAAPGEGKSFVSSHLAMSLAAVDQRVCLIDADLRRPRLHTMFDRQRAPGLSDVLLGRRTTAEVLRPVGAQGLVIVSSGLPTAKAAELLSYQSFRTFIEELRSDFDWIIIDSPPIMAVADAAVLSRDATAVLFVTSAEQTSLEAAEAALNELGAAGARLLGAVLNRAPITREAFYYSKYYQASYEPYLTPTESSEPTPSGCGATGPSRHVMSAWLTPQSLAAFAVALTFLALALQRPSRAVLAYAVLGAAPPAIQLGAFSGRTISQGLLLAEALASVLIGAWLTRGNTIKLGATDFDKPLFTFVGACLASMVGILVLPDHRVEGDTSTAVSIGQVLLVLWPVGVYFAAREFITETTQLRWLQRAMVTLAIGQLVAPFAPDAVAAVPWLGLDVRDLRLAVCAGRDVLDHVGAGAGVLPADRGAALRARRRAGKAFLYGYVAVAGLTVLAIRASRLTAALAGLGVAAADGRHRGARRPGPDLAAGTPPEQGTLADELRRETGRGALASAAISIWMEAPLLGVGPGNSYVYMLQRSPIGTPHNQYLNILVEFGIVGLVAWLVFLVAAWRTGLRIYREATHPVHRSFALGWLGMFAGMVVGGVTGDFMMHSIRNGGIELFSGYYLQWVLLGGLAAIPVLERRLHRADSTPAAARPRYWRASPARRLPAPSAARVPAG